MLKRTAKYYANHDAGMHRLFCEFWSVCSPDVMSGDETDSEWDGDHDAAPHFIFVLEWRNPEVVNFFRTMYGLYYSTRFKSDDKPGMGKFPHRRIVSYRTTSGQPVSGLPRNFYNPGYLATLDPIELQRLNILPAIDLNFSPAILRFVTYFRIIIRPTPTDLHFLSRTA